jgi:membrane protein implicated in regulation of membrane protease activity
MSERPSPDQRNSATLAALTMVLLVSGGLLALIALVLPQVLWLVVIAVGLALSVVLQYLVWGRWLTSKLRDEAEQEEPPPDRH